MRRLLIVLAGLFALVGGVSLPVGNARAAVVAAASGIRVGLDTLRPLQNVQAYYWGGRQYCWYDDGWRGPGWYWCGYAWRRGYGWGGVYGWHGWGGGHVRREYRRHERREYRHERREYRHERREHRR